MPTGSHPLRFLRVKGAKTLVNSGTIWRTMVWSSMSRTRIILVAAEMLGSSEDIRNEVLLCKSRMALKQANNFMAHLHSFYTGDPNQRTIFPAGSRARCSQKGRWCLLL